MPPPSSSVLMPLQKKVTIDKKFILFSFIVGIKMEGSEKYSLVSKILDSKISRGFECNLNCYLFGYQQKTAMIFEAKEAK